MRKTLWTAKEDNFVKKHVGKMLIKEIAKKLNRSTKALHTRACKIGLGKFRLYDNMPYNLEEAQRVVPTIIAVRTLGEKSEGLVSCPLRFGSCLYPRPRWVKMSSLTQTGIPGGCIACTKRPIASFTFEQQRMLDAIGICQFPNCLETENLVRDHAHNQKGCEHRKTEMCRLCFRSILCHGHNIVMAHVDRHPKRYKGRVEFYLFIKRPMIKNLPTDFS